MFTGVIRATGTLAGLAERGGDRRLSIKSAGLPWREYAVGESIAVNGVCLTAVGFSEDGFDADVSRETLSVTTLGTLATGSPVNLEPALALGERLGGHLVSGHVDGLGTVTERRQDGRAWRFGFELPAELSRYVARKGSVAIDGVSLTINDVSGNRFGVSIIPHTLDETIFAHYRVGTRVNVEVDMMARYLERLAGADASPGLTRDTLKAQGYG